jgi:hypothetical protein
VCSGENGIVSMISRRGGYPIYFQLGGRIKPRVASCLGWERLGISPASPMVVRPFARRTAVILIALLIATQADAPSAYAGEGHHTGVKRLWSLFPLGPQLRMPPVRRTSTAQQPTPSTAQRSQSDSATSSPSGQTTFTRTGSSVPQASPAGSTLLPPWGWALLTGAAAMLVAITIWMPYLPRSKNAATRRDNPAGQVTGAESPPPKYHPSASGEPRSLDTPKQHPWASGEPRTLDTLPRAELFAMGKALGIRDAILMSREELITALRRREPMLEIASSDASDHELARYAALYAAACRAGNPAPILAVTETLPPTIDEPATHASQIVAEARRRGLLTSHDPGKPGRGELTGRARQLLLDPTRTSPPTMRE